MFPGDRVSYSLERIRESSQCEDLIRDANELIRHAYTAANTIARRSYVYQYDVESETFAFALHCPGSDRTAHLPGFRLAELPESLASLSQEVCERMDIRQGRVLYNIGRYPVDYDPLTPHYDGELFDYDVAPGVGNTVRSAIRPRQVAILTLRNEAISAETRLHDDAGNVLQPRAQAGDLLRFDNTLYQHSVPRPSPSPAPATSQTRLADDRRWIRYTMGWRAFEHDCFYWEDEKPLCPIGFDEAIALHEAFLKDLWPQQIETDLARATFPFETTRS
jgi:hypothetical protein